jgi:hypothetical protein
VLLRLRCRCQRRNGHHPQDPHAYGSVHAPISGHSSPHCLARGPEGLADVIDSRAFTVAPVNGVAVLLSTNKNVLITARGGAGDYNACAGRTMMARNCKDGP